MVNRAGRVMRSATSERPTPRADHLPSIQKALHLPKGANLSWTALTLPDKLSLDSWKALGTAVCAINEGSQWWLGDWWAHGEHSYRERARAFAKGVFGSYSFGTLMTYGSVARAIEPSIRIEVLSFAHHQVVASRPPDEQRAWLDKAAKGKWSVSALRQAIYSRDQTDWWGLGEVEQFLIRHLRFNDLVIGRVVPASQHQFGPECSRLV
jgi:hypothetical protein